MFSAMVTIPLEDNFNDILGKAQRGLGFSIGQLAERARLSMAEVQAALEGEFQEATARKLAPVLGLGADALVALGRRTWGPERQKVTGLACFNTPYGDMTVNAYIVWDPKGKQAVAFDTGASADGMLEFAQNLGLKIELILLTHIHGDHIAALDRLQGRTGAKVWVSEREPVRGAEPCADGHRFTLGPLSIETRRTSGHSRGGTTYVVRGLERPVAVVGDALFAGSMGGGLVSYEEALRTNRAEIFTLPDNTVICPGHGPLTTVGEEKQHNPFYPEFTRA